MEVGVRCDSNNVRRALMSSKASKPSRRPRTLVIMAASPSTVIGVGFLPSSPGIADTRLIGSLILPRLRSAYGWEEGGERLRSGRRVGIVVAAGSGGGVREGVARARERERAGGRPREANWN